MRFSPVDLVTAFRKIVLLHVDLADPEISLQLPQARATAHVRDLTSWRVTVHGGNPH